MTEQRLDPPDPALVRRLVEVALEEDGARRDVTTQALVDNEERGSGAIVAKANGVLCGMPVAARAFAALNGVIHVEPFAPEGASIRRGDTLARVEGPLAPILSAERVALNFLQRLSGIATVTRALVDAVVALDVRIVDTRKTTPGLRALERYAVRAGGGRNHRFNLSDGVLIKDNHLAAARARGLSIAHVVEQARRSAAHTLRIEIEVTTVQEAREAIDAGADIVLLDNMSAEEMREAVAVGRASGRSAQFEASGGVTLENVRAIAQTGVDIISAGSITHSAPALDLSLDIEASGR